MIMADHLPNCAAVVALTEAFEDAYPGGGYGYETSPNGDTVRWYRVDQCRGEARLVAIISTTYAPAATTPHHCLNTLAIGDGILVGAYATVTLRLIKERASNADGGGLVRMALPEPQQRNSTQADRDAALHRAYAGLGIYGWAWRLRQWWQKHKQRA